MIATVENNHFAPEVQALVRGQSSYLGGDLDFILRAIPNHHKVLLLIVTFGERMKWTRADGLQYSYDCYFERAIRFAPNDAFVRMANAIYLNKRTRPDEALAQLKVAVNLAGDNAFTHYNAGLLYFDMKQYDLALAQAHSALALGFERTDLRDRLQSAGKWRDPSPPAAEAPRESIGTTPTEPNRPATR